MRVVHHIQGSPEWLKWREGKLTASKTSAIMGISPYQTPYSLWEVELGVRPPDPDNPHMQRGRFLEPFANAYFCKKNDVIAAPPICILHPEHDDIAASLDGYFVDDGNRKVVLEIKCPCDSEWNNILVHGIEEVYFYYISQVKHQLACAEADVGILWVYHLSSDIEGADPEDLVTIFEPDKGMVTYKQESKMLIIHRDHQWEQDDWLPALDTFRNCLVNKKPPEIDPQRDVFLNNSAAWRLAAKVWKEKTAEIERLKFELEMAEADRAEADETLTNLALAIGFPNCRGEGVRHAHQVRNGSIDWKQLAEDHLPNMDLDVLANQYRKKPVIINSVKRDKLS